MFLDTRRLLTDLVSAPEYSLGDDYSWIKAQSFSDTLVSELMEVDLSKLGSDFRVPIIFFEERHDQYCPPSLIWEYSQTIKAPQKESSGSTLPATFRFF